MSISKKDKCESREQIRKKNIGKEWRELNGQVYAFRLQKQLQKVQEDGTETDHGGGRDPKFTILGSGETSLTFSSLLFITKTKL